MQNMQIVSSRGAYVASATIRRGTGYKVINMMTSVGSEDVTISLFGPKGGWKGRVSVSLSRLKDLIWALEEERAEMEMEGRNDV